MVVFSFSLVVACIRPVFAIDFVSGDPLFSVYASFPTYDPSFHSDPVAIPFTGNHIFHTITPSSALSNVSFNIQIPTIAPVDYDRTLSISLGVTSESSSASISSSSSVSQDVTWYQSSYRSNVLSGGSWASFDDAVYSTYGKFVVCNITIPANCTGLQTRSGARFNTSGNGNDIFGLTSFGGYVISSADRDVVNQVNAILDEVKKVNGNLTSALSVLNEILVQCQGIKADTASIVSILGLCKNQLVTLNGKVNDIYTLLKDSLTTESQALDQKSENVAGQIMQRVDSEQYWSDKNTENFNALDMGNWSFGDGVVGALPTVGNLFKSLWDSFGDATLIFVFPLMLGIALVIVGRLSRTSGKGSKKGGGDDG